MKRLFGVLAILVLLVANFAAPVSAQEPGPLDQITPEEVDITQLVAEGHHLWFIEFSSNPLADGGTTTRIAKDKSNFRAAAERAGVQYTERFDFDTLWNGISVDASGPELNRLARLPGVKAVYPVLTYQIPPEQQVNLPELATALQMTGADVAQSELGYTGAGIKVAVMDTGVDFDHPDLGGCFGPGCRVEMGWDFVGDDYNADDTSPTYNPIPSPDPIPDDCNGHGTHVAGIIGANGEVKGVAPDVTFGAYRVFGCDGSTDSDIMLAAMQQALADGMQVLNMSIGSAFTWPQYPTAQASDRLVTKGMVVVASIGNSGTNGPFAGGAPGLGKKVIGVASFDNTHISALTFNALPSGLQIPFLKLESTVDLPTSGVSAPLVDVGGNGCLAQASYPDVSGKVALIQRGSCTFNEKYARAVGAGATGVVIFNNTPGIFAGGGVVDLGVWGAGISLADGVALKAQIAAGETTLEFTDVRINAQNPTGGLISSFSSYGLSPDLTLKPDLGAPGGLIRSTYPLELGGYAILSGTSMSSPHVAGSVALLLQARPRLNPNSVRTLLLNNSDPKLWSQAPVYGILDMVHRQGAGMLDIVGAIQATTTIEPAKLSLGEVEGDSVTQVLNIKNGSRVAKTYNLSHVPALATYTEYFSTGFYDLFADASFSQDSVTVPPMGSVKVSVTITNPGYSGFQFGGYVVVTSEDGEEQYSVPYAGFSGDYQAINIMANNPYGLPWLLKDGYIVGVEVADAVYSLENGDVPTFWVQLEHQARTLSGEVFMVDQKGRSIPYYRAFYEDYLPRNATNGNIWEFIFDGTTMAGQTVKVVPDGNYYVVIKVLKPLGDPANPAHWENWTSPVFTIDRP